MSKITIDRAVVEQALEALEYYEYRRIEWDYKDAQAIDALRAALEQPNHIAQHLNMVPEGWRLVPVEPTDSQIRAAQDTWWHACNSEMYWDQIYAAMLAAAPQPPVVEQPQVEQSSVVGVIGWKNHLPNSGTVVHWTALMPPLGTKLYIHPQPPRQPLTDAQINDHRLALAYDSEDLPDTWDFKQGVRAAERAHGIGGEA